MRIFALFFILGLVSFSPATMACMCSVEKQNQQDAYNRAENVAVIAILEKPCKNIDDCKYTKIRTLKNIKGELPETFIIKYSALTTSCSSHFGNVGHISIKGFSKNPQTGELDILNLCENHNLSKKFSAYDNFGYSYLNVPEFNPQYGEN